MRQNEALNFVKPVAITTQGIIIRGNDNTTPYFREDGSVYYPDKPRNKPTKYQIIWSTTGAISNLDERQCQQIDEYLEQHNHFKDDDLFTL